MKAIRSSMLLAMAFVLAGCDNRTQELLAMRIELTAIKQELELIREASDDFDPRLRAAEEFAARLFTERDSTIPIDCNTGGATSLPAPIATLSVICDAAQPVADGVRFQLRLGNPTSARIEALALTLHAGAGATQGRAEHRHPIDVVAPLAPGAWTRVDIEWPGLAPEHTAELALRARAGRLALALR